MRKLTALVFGGIGYVLGARAGRERYEQIRNAAQRVKSNPKVQETARQATDVAKEKAPVVKDKISGGGSSNDDSDTGANGVPMEGSAYPTSDRDAKP